MPLKGHEAAGLVVVQLGHHANPEMEFLYINLRKDSILLLHAIHSVSTDGFLKENQTLLWF
jgi:hypothetical protein